MKYKVNIVETAEEDILEIYKYVYLNDSEEKAEKLYTNIQKRIIALQENPQRGRAPKELQLFQMKEFLEIQFKPYRIIYQIIEKNVYVHCILDGRRDMQSLLHERLLRTGQI